MREIRIRVIPIPEPVSVSPAAGWGSGSVLRDELEMTVCNQSTVSSDYDARMIGLDFVAIQADKYRGQ